MAYDGTDSNSGWKEKAIFYLKIGVAAALVIWIFTIAFGARGTANQNAELLRTPGFQISHVVGGPQRFAENYKDVENVDTEEKVNEDQYLWSTLIIKNTGNKEADELNFKIKTLLPMQKVLITPPGWSNDVKISLDNKKKSADISMQELDTGEEAYIFIAMEPAGYNKPYDLSARQRWLHEYDIYLEKITVETNTTTISRYGPGYSAYYEE